MVSCEVIQFLQGISWKANKLRWAPICKTKCSVLYPYNIQLKYDFAFAMIYILQIIFETLSIFSSKVKIFAINPFAPNRAWDFEKIKNHVFFSRNRSRSSMDIGDSAIDNSDVCLWNGVGNSTFRQQKATPLALKISKKLKKGGFFHAQKVLGGKHHTDMGQKMVYLAPEDAMASKVHITNRWTCIHMISLSQIKNSKNLCFWLKISFSGSALK